MNEIVSPDQQNANSASQARATIELLDGGAGFVNGVLVPTGEQYEEIRDTHDYIKPEAVKMAGSLSLYDKQEAEAMSPIGLLIQERERQEQLRADITAALLDYDGIFYNKVPYEKEGDKNKQTNTVTWREFTNRQSKQGEQTNTYDFSLDYTHDSYGSRIQSVTMSITPKDKGEDTQKSKISKLTRNEDITTRKVKYDLEAGQINGIRLTPQYDRENRQVAGSWLWGATDSGHPTQELQQRVLTFNQAASSLFEDGNIVIDLRKPNPVIEATAISVENKILDHRPEGQLICRYEYDPKSNTFIRTGGDMSYRRYAKYKPGDLVRPDTLTTEEFCEIVQGAVALIPLSDL